MVLGDFSFVGQNLYYSWTSRQDGRATSWEKAVDSWYNEVNDFIHKGQSVKHYR